MDLVWPTRNTASLAAGVHRVAHDATAAGGAIGWTAPPARSDTDRWLASVLTAVADGDAALCAASVDGAVVGFGAWRREPEALFRHTAALAKVTVHPAAQGRGVGRALAAALVGNARAAGMENAHMRVRGNNTRAIALYESLGFTEYGRFPNSIEVGEERFDAVWLYRELQRPPGVVLRGGQRPARATP